MPTERCVLQGEAQSARACAPALQGVRGRAREPDAVVPEGIDGAALPSAGTVEAGSRRGGEPGIDRRRSSSWDRPNSQPFGVNVSQHAPGTTAGDHRGTNDAGGSSVLRLAGEVRGAGDVDVAPDGRGSGTRGFTLIEIMVALVVLSLAALALIRLEGQTIRSTGVVSSTLLAQIVARNVAIEAVTDPQPPVRGRATGIEQAGGRSWTWARDVQPLGDGDVQRIDVAVSESDSGGAVLGRATMVRPPPAPIQTQVGQPLSRQPDGSLQGSGQTGQGS